MYESAPCAATPYACGLEYLPALAEAMESTTTDIIFQGWKFELSTPLLGADRNLTFLTAVQRAIARGVRVYVLMWRNTISAPADHWKIMGFNVSAVSKVLKMAGARVLLDKGHPHNLLERVEPSFRWCEHMKTVVLDQRRVFVTGIDIAESRVDSCDHKWPDTRRVKAESETGYNEFWQDSAVLAEGQVAHDVAKVAIGRWEESCKLAPDHVSDCTDGPTLRKPVPLEGATQQCGVRLSGSPFLLDISSPLHEIQDEYISAILNAKRTVFVENLYLSSKLLSEDDGFLHRIFPISESQNGVLSAIWRRLKRAVDEGQVDGSFNVVVVVPAATEEPFTQFINLQSIWDKKRGLIYTLQNYLVAKGYPKDVWGNMLRVFCLVEVNAIQDGSWNFMTIYIHTKVLIVDGNVAIVGSANLNDRSLLATGDAELDLRIDGDFALSLQRRLLGFHAPSGYSEDRLALSLGQIADGNWAKLEVAWPEMFNASCRAGRPVFSSTDVSKVTFGMFVPREAASVVPPSLDGLLIPWREDLWGPPEHFGTWERAVSKLPWLGPALRSSGQPKSEPLSSYISI